MKNWKRTTPDRDFAWLQWRNDTHDVIHDMWVKKTTIADVASVEMRREAVAGLRQKNYKRFSHPIFKAAKELKEFYGWRDSNNDEGAKHGMPYIYQKYLPKGRTLVCCRHSDTHGLGGISWDYISPNDEAKWVKAVLPEDVPLLLGVLKTKKGKEAYDARCRGKIPDPIYRQDLVNLYYRGERHIARNNHFIGVCNAIIDRHVHSEYHNKMDLWGAYGQYLIIVPINGREYIYSKKGTDEVVMRPGDMVIHAEPIGKESS